MAARHRTLLPVLAAAVLAVAGAGDVLAEAGGSLQASPCWFDGAQVGPVRCAWFRPSRQDSRRATRLPVVVLRDSVRRPSDRAVIYLTGGPGVGSGLDAAGLRTARLWHGFLGLRRDLVLYDQRGSGRAEPPLSCAGEEQHLQAVLSGPQSHAERMAKSAKFLLGCALRVPSADRASGLYGTATAAGDLRELIAALAAEHGYTAFSLYGESYGTRLAIEAVRDGNLPVDRMVLDSVYPPGVGSHLAILPEHFERLLEAIERRCHAIGACPSTSGGIRAPLRRALDRLAKAPLVVEGNDLAGGRGRVPLRLEANDLFELLFAGLYGEDRTAGLPAMLDDLAGRGPDDRWQALFDTVVTMWLDPSTSLVAHHLIGCRDNPPLEREKLDKQLAAWPGFADALRPQEWQYGLCERLGVLPAPLATDWTVKVPTLLLGRSVDPATPLEQLIPVRHRFRNAAMLVLPGAGHGVVGFDPAISRRAGRFLDGDPDPVAGPGDSGRR